MGIAFDETLPQVLALIKTQTSRPQQQHHRYHDGGVYGPTDKAIYTPQQIVTATRGEGRGKPTVYVKKAEDGTLEALDSNALARTAQLSPTRRTQYWIERGYQPLTLEYLSVEPTDVRLYEQADAEVEGFKTLVEFWTTWMRLHEARRMIIYSHRIAGKANSDEFTQQMRLRLLDRPAKPYQVWRIRFRILNVTPAAEF